MSWIIEAGATNSRFVNGCDVDTQTVSRLLFKQGVEKDPILEGEANAAQGSTALHGVKQG